MLFSGPFTVFWNSILVSRMNLDPVSLKVLSERALILENHVCQQRLLSLEDIQVLQKVPGIILAFVSAKICFPWPTAKYRARLGQKTVPWLCLQYRALRILCACGGWLINTKWWCNAHNSSHISVRNFSENVSLTWSYRTEISWPKCCILILSFEPLYAASNILLIFQIKKVKYFVFL